MPIRFIGDIHGKVGQMLALAGSEPTVQIGDFGMGFMADPVLPATVRFIRGNHDSPAACQACPAWIPDGHCEAGVFYLGGAWSIDWQVRVSGLSWWPDEECSNQVLDSILADYCRQKPALVVSHDCPDSVAESCFLGGRLRLPTRTSACLQEMLEAHQPDLWVFGHWHRRLDTTVGKTRFVCLEELGILDVPWAEWPSGPQMTSKRNP